MKKLNNKGFTLAELLIVVAIIAVLVAISIPIFVGQLENSREATDAANIRSAYAEVSAAALANPRKDYSITVKLQQLETGWSNENIDNIAGISKDSIDISTEQKIKDGIVVEYSASNKYVTIAGNKASERNIEKNTPSGGEAGNS